MTKAHSAAGPGQTPHPFYPNHVFVEAVVALLALLALALLAFFWQVPLEEIADPSDSAYVPRPEWYFLFYFQLLKYFKGPLMVVGTFVLPVLAGAMLILWPFLDRGEETRLSRRPRAAALGFGVLLAIFTLTGLAVMEDSELHMDLPPITEGQMAEGADIFNRFCMLCHAMDGKGGFMAPDLTQVGSRVNRVYIERVVINPDIVSQTTIMSRIPLSDEERHAVSAYLSRRK
ncbi:MAG: c-type cytochrome [Candidatus Adiutrix sp.]|jgi:ubiquinol-cytochrome c reductase cytochrome b subunit|nr:c-type cytochrome [Candidatus Adiutrix sp.]